MIRQVVELGKKCPSGKIWRDPYRYQREGKVVKVKGKCIEDVGKKGKTPPGKRVLPRPVPGELYGWKADLPATERRKSLKKATRSEGCRGVISRMNMERGYTKRTSPSTYKKLVADQKWLRKQDFCKLKEKGD